MALHLVVLCHHLWVLLVLHLGLLFFFFGAGITVANGYWCIWLWIHNREKRKIEVLGFREFAYGFTISISPQPYQTLGFFKFFSKSSLYVGKLFFFWCLTHTHYSIFSLCLVSKKIKGKKNIGYCSLCCLSFILLCKGWNFWFVFDWEGERNSGFCDLCCWGSCKDERLIESWAKWVFKTKIEEFDFFYSYMVAEKICESLGIWKKKIWV